MSIGVELNVDASEVMEQAAAEDRALYERALINRDEGAAALLLSRYLALGLWYAPEVQEAIEDGMRNVLRAVLSEPGLSLRVQPLMFFDVAMGRKRGSKGGATRRKPVSDGSKLISSKMTEIVKARAFSGARLTKDEVKEALTTQWEAVESVDNAKPTRWLAPSKYPQTYGAAEERLIEYLCQRRHKAMDPAEARRFVRHSLPNNPWDAPDTPVDYPPSWQ